jgi:hypothetical protein
MEVDAVAAWLSHIYLLLKSALEDIPSVILRQMATAGNQVLSKVLSGKVSSARN